MLDNVCKQFKMETFGSMFSHTYPHKHTAKMNKTSVDSNVQIKFLKITFFFKQLQVKYIKGYENVAKLNSDLNEP